MKVPLRYQITEFDCGAVALVNCLSFLFDREEIPVELLKKIHMHTLDCYCSEGNVGRGGTSRDAVKYISRRIIEFANRKDFGIECEYLIGDQVTFEKIKDWVQSGGCALFRCWHIDVEHYVTITKIDDDFVYLFDPYYLERDYYDKNKHIEIIPDQPFTANRKVCVDYFKNKKGDLSLNSIKLRETLLMKRA